MTYITDQKEKPLVIRASAGTGKTYRLSLEFINLILKYRMDFAEILVITFTKKATAEIRERIFLQLYDIINNTPEGIILKKNIQQNINPEITFNQEEMDLLQSVYQRMITNKSAVKISTIDSFVNTVFSGIIAPYHNITDYAIDNKINNEILPEIYESILQDDNLKKYEDIFLQAKRRNLDQFRELITSIIENRWLFEFIDLTDFLDLDLESNQDKAFEKYQIELNVFLEILQNEFLKKDVSINLLLQKKFTEIVSSYLDFSDFQKTDLADKLFHLLSSKIFLEENFKLLLDDKNIWNGNRIRNKELKELYRNVQSYLAEFLYYNKALTEQFNIISLAADVLHVYDKIKLRDKVFTHSDISYYTLNFLYDPNISIVDQGNVLNIFYEQLSYKIRFVLIDEFQDTSILQWSIFQPMLKEITSGVGQKDYGRVIVVGDEKQAIYGWRGGERKLLTEFENIIDETIEYETLTTSYRSKPVLMNWLNKLFGSKLLELAANWSYNKINSAKPEGGFVQVDLRNCSLDESKMAKAEIYREFVQNNLIPHLNAGRIIPADTAIIMRKNNELEIMAEILEEKGIDFTLEMSDSLFQYKAIKPILFVLKFLAYDDFMELIKFLRSDLVLIDTKMLKKIITEFHSSRSLDEFLKNCSLHPYLQVLYKLRINNCSLVLLIKNIMKEFNFLHIFDSEIELKNLQRFWEIAAEFERANHEYAANKSGFLEYCRSLSEKDEYSQIGQSWSDSIKLLTIHKSKGLQFKTVFTVFDVSGKMGGNDSRLNLYYRFADNLRSLDDFACTYNFDKILKKSQKQGLIDFVSQRNNADELNNIYVALTRAKNNLFIYLHYSKKGSLAKFIKDQKGNDSIFKKITKIIFHECNDDLKEISEKHHQIRFGELSTETNYEEDITETKMELPQYFDIFDPEFKEIKNPNLNQLAKEFLINKRVLIGNITHDFLSYIKYMSSESLETARFRTITKYGSLLHNSELEKIFAIIEQFILNNSVYFDNSKWDRVFNEFSIFDENGNEFRLDRLLIDTASKQILIVDYKTGSYYEQEQLDRYKKIIEKLPVVLKEGFNVKTKFVEIDFN